MIGAGVIKLDYPKVVVAILLFIFSSFVGKFLALPTTYKLLTPLTIEYAVFDLEFEAFVGLIVSNLFAAIVTATFICRWIKSVQIYHGLAVAISVSTYKLILPDGYELHMALVTILSGCCFIFGMMATYIGKLARRDT